MIDPDTLQELGPSEVGEIVSSGPQVFQGYWKSPEATAACFIELDGKRFFRTGDLGCYDEDGYFFIIDRLKRMINASGYKVWPAEVEAMLYAHPDVQEACVIGAQRSAPRRDRQGGGGAEGGQPRQESAPEEIIGWCREHMAAYKVPRVVEFVDSLPKSATGKIQWRVLQERSTKGRLTRSLTLALAWKPEDYPQDLAEAVPEEPDASRAPRCGTTWRWRRRATRTSRSRSSTTRA